MVAWLKKILRWLGVLRDAGTPIISRTTVEGAPSAGLTHALTHDLTHTRLPPDHPLLAERVNLPLRKRRKKSPMSNAEYQARHRAKAKAADRDGYLRRKREDEAARRARKKAEKAAAQVAGQAGVSAGVVDFQAVRARRAGEVVDHVEQAAQRALPD
jgi:hypothetical protein